MPRFPLAPLTLLDLSGSVYFRAEWAPAVAQQREALGGKEQTGLASRSGNSQSQDLCWQRGSIRRRLSWKAGPHPCLMVQLGPCIFIPSSAPETYWFLLRSLGAESREQSPLWSYSGWDPLMSLGQATFDYR